MKVALLGASDKPDRFAYKAFKKLQASGHQVFLVHPKLTSIEGTPVWAGLASLPEKPDTVTLYISEAVSTPLAQAILSSGARRVIFNPGTENPELEAVLKNAGIKIVHDCTLMMLDGSRF